MPKPRLETFGDLTGQVHVGYRRTDLPIVHTIHRAKAGTRFQVADHFRTCLVCRAHQITEADFARWYAQRSAS